MFIKNADWVHTFFTVIVRAKWSLDEIILQKRKSSLTLKEYHDKNIREHKEWVHDVEILFYNTSWYFEMNAEKIIYAMIYLQDESKKLWYDHEDINLLLAYTWSYFINFLLNLLEDLMNQSINMTQQYANAVQHSN